MSDVAYRFREYSGGCQCGAVRFHATELRDNPHLCHLLIVLLVCLGARLMS